MIWDGFTGPQLAPKNLATVLSWLHFRGVAVAVLLVAGNLFCMACPFMLVRNLARRLVKPARSWPARLRNKYLAALILAAYLFTYEWLNLWESPRATALVIVFYFALALALDSLFRGAPFCKYVCPLGQFNFLSSTISPLEVGVRDLERCHDCQTKDCIKGRGDIPGCELGLFQEKKVGNLDCTFCLDCVQACPYENVAVQIRLPAAELADDTYRSSLGHLSHRPDLTLLMVVFTFGALLNVFGMISPAYALASWLGWRSDTAFLVALFAAMLVLEPLLLLGAAAALSRLPGRSLLQTAVRFTPCLVPLAFSVWLAHYFFHFLTGFWTILPLVKQFFTSEVNWVVPPLLSGGELVPLEYALLTLGLGGSLWVAGQIARAEGRPRAAWPWWVVCALLAVSAVWMLSQPMEMRGTFLS